MRTSSAGISLIKKWEGLRLTAYPDPATKGEPYTIGYGHTSRAGPPSVKPGMKINSIQAENILKDDLVEFESAIQNLLKRTPTQSQFDAMVSLVYNIGIGAFSKSTVLRKFNAGDVGGAADAFLLFVKANGRVMNGLVSRRTDERDMFLKGTNKEQKKEDDSEVVVTPASDSEIIVSDPKPVYQHRRVWTSVLGWVSGGGVAAFGAFSGFDWRTLVVLVAALAFFVLFFWYIYRREIEKGLFSR